MANRPSTLVEPKQELDWQGSGARSRVLSLIYGEHARSTLPLYPTVNPSYLLGDVARYRVDFRDEPAGKGKIMVSCRVVSRVGRSDLALIECVKSDYR